MKNDRKNGRLELRNFYPMKKVLAFGSICCLLPVLLGVSSPEMKKQVEEEHPYDSLQMKAQYHIIVVIDGPRWSETYGDTSYQYIPNLGNVLKKEGTLFTNFRNEGSTYTNSGHTAICTGVHQRISNQGKELPKHPSIFQYLIKERQLDKRKAWVLTSKGKLDILANTTDKEWWNKYMPSTYCGIGGSGVGYPEDKSMFPIFKDIITEHKPILTLINFLDIDSWGHEDNWERYLQAHRDVDSLVMELWNLVQNDPVMKNKTALYITNDHGRHLDGHKNGFVSHGDGCEGCRHISLLAIGPDYQKNREVTTCYDQIDLTATLAAIFGLTMEDAKGCPIPELLGH